MKAHQPTSLLHVLLERTQRTPERTAFVSLREGEQEEGRWSYGELLVRAAGVCARLSELGAEGERVIIALPAGLDFVATFLGCFACSAVAVPIPALGRPLSRALSRIQPIASDARPAVLVSARANADLRRQLMEQVPALRGVRNLDVEDVQVGEGQELRASPGGDELAMLQYTSGSTSAPKGVMVLHRNMMSNAAFYASGWGHGADACSVTWMPHFHDLGLMDGVIQPIFAGFPSILMSPGAFLQRPTRWLDAASRYRATFSSGPPFAFELCTEKPGSDGDLPQRDLSSLECMLIAAEPIRAKTIARFEEVFGPQGLRPNCLRPGYGLAEATLKVAATPKGVRRSYVSLECGALSRGEVREALRNSESSIVEQVVGCGPVNGPDDTTRVRIVDPETGSVLGPDAVGEVWVSGPGVAAGYWGAAEESTATFAARLASGAAEAHLRTGDLGFVRAGQLFITGRLKDLIIVRGRNIYPQDLEWTTQEAARDVVRTGCAVAFGLEEETSESIVILAEVRQRSEFDAAGTIVAIRSRLNEIHEIAVKEVVLLRQGTLLKTSSGKVRRRACRDAYLSGKLIRHSTDAARAS